MSFERVAAHTIEQLGGEALALAADKALSDEDRADRFRAMLARELDIPTLARFAVARGWRRAEPADRDAYVDAFSDYILARYGTVLDGARDVERFAIVGAHRISDGDAIVTTRLTLVDRRQLVIAWRMCDAGGEAKILDIVVEGMSAAQTLRQEFAAVLRANDGPHGGADRRAARTGRLIGLAETLSCHGSAIRPPACYRSRIGIDTVD